MGGLSIWHWLIVLVVVVLIFGTKKLRNIGQDSGRRGEGIQGRHEDRNRRHRRHDGGRCHAGAADPREDHRRRGQEGNHAVVVTITASAQDVARDGAAPASSIQEVHRRMFDVGFSEVVVIAVVALIVIGPERLPKAARTMGLLFGRLQRYVGDVKADISREMELDELRKLQKQVQGAAQEFKTSVESAAQNVHAGCAASRTSSTPRPPRRRRADAAGNSVAGSGFARPAEPGRRAADAGPRRRGSRRCPDSTRSSGIRWPTRLPTRPSPPCRTRSCRIWSNCVRG